MFEDIKNANILIVDDESINIQLLQEMLSNEGYTSIRATTRPSEVVEIYREFRPDLILLDLMMPEMDGFEVMQVLKEAEQETYLPILVLTALSDQKTRLRALDSGAKDFLTKPLNQLEVLTRIRNMLEVRILHNRVRDHNMILEQKVRERTRELAETRLDIIQRLGKAAEFRDNETGLHVIRMSRYAHVMGKQLGFAEDEAQTLLNASPMHDIGKIGIPESILMKPSRLSEAEWGVMKTHCKIGADLLRGGDFKLLEMAATIALTHHEKWDGSGYPAGLSGEEIPRVGRICALADVFDALSSARPYKRAWTVDESVGAIKEEVGRHFEPDVVECFCDNLPEILEIRKQYMEPEMH